MMTDLDKRQINIALMKRSFWDYCRIKIPSIYNKDAHYLKELCDILQEFENDDNELLVINIPPQHGKSLTATLLSQWLLGRNPNLKIITASYNERLARRMSESVRNAILENKADDNILVFSDIFPNIKLQKGSTAKEMWKLQGSKTYNYLATSPNGTVTGFHGDFIIIDDLIKTHYEASHQGILEEHFRWFSDTLYSRLSGKRKLLVVFTRWATKDLAGRLIKLYTEQNRKFKVITKKAFDGEVMLNPNIMNKEQYDLLRLTIGDNIVKANYDQEPIDLKGNLYQEFKTWKSMPNIQRVLAVTDTADTGSDYLAHITYGVDALKDIYVLDVYYTQDKMEVTESETANRLIRYNVVEYFPESNSGGRGFSRAVEKICREKKHYATRFNPYTQSKNKQARIISTATEVNNRVYMPENWKMMYPEFYKHITGYQQGGKNAHDDGADALTACVEMINNEKPPIMGYSRAVF